MSGTPKDFLVSRQENAAPADDASFAFVGPPGTSERFKLLISREVGDELSILPIREARFKKGLRCWRWKDADGEDYEVYVTVKTTGRRIDLRRVDQ